MHYFGEQFDNTYFLKDDNNLVVQQHPFTEKAREQGRAIRRKGEEQGMLFPPHAYTRTGFDPTYSMKDRLSDIESTFDFDKITGPQKDRFLGAMARTTLPTNFFESPSALRNAQRHSRYTRNTTVIPTESSKRAGAYRPVTNRLAVNVSPEATRSNKGIDSSETMMHELGHRELVHNSLINVGYALSNREVKTTKRNLFISPIHEGVADGYMERYGTPSIPQHGAYLDYTLNPERVDELEYDTRSSYTIKSRHWETQSEQALYAAARLHVARGGREAIKSIPDVDLIPGIDKRPSKVSGRQWNYHLALGKLVAENPSLHEPLEQLGFGDVSKHAEKTHFAVVANAEKERHAHLGEQLKLFSNDDPSTISKTSRNTYDLAKFKRQDLQKKKKAPPRTAKPIEDWFLF